MSSLKSFIKDKWLYITAVLIILGILYYRFGNSLFRGSLMLLIFILVLFLFFTDTGHTFLNTVIGSIIILGVAFEALRALFGKTAPFVVIGCVLLFMYPKLQKKYKLAKEKEMRREAIEIKRREEQEIIAKNKEIIDNAAANGYFTGILNERIKTFNAVPEALLKEIIVSERQPKVKWLTLDQQLQFLKDNEDRLNSFKLVSNGRNFLQIIKNCLEDVKGVEYNRSMKDYLYSLNELYAQYKFDYGAIYKKLNDALYSYNEYYQKVYNDYYHALEGKRNGIMGEDRVSKELSVYEDVIWNLTNIRFEVEGESVESDSILITENGLFSLEIKNFGEDSHDTIRITKDGQWIKEFTDGNKYVMKDVASQVNRHIGYKQRFINEKLKEKLGDDTPSYIRIQPLIVIANDNVYIKNESDLPIVRASNVYHHVTNTQGTLDRKYWNVIKEIILENNLPPKKFPIEEHFGCLEQEYNSLWEQIKAYYVLTGMARTYIHDLNKARCDISMANSPESLLFNSEKELKG